MCRVRPKARPPCSALAGRTRLDDAFAATIAQSLAAAGVPATAAPRRARLPAEEAGLDGRTAVVLCFLDPNPSRVLADAPAPPRRRRTRRPPRRGHSFKTGHRHHPPAKSATRPSPSAPPSFALTPKDLPRALTETGVA